jgi:hypothetical protein
MFPYIIVFGVSALGGYFLGRKSIKSSIVPVAGPIFTIGLSLLPDSATMQAVGRALAEKLGWDVRSILDGDLTLGPQPSVTIAFMSTVKNPPLPAVGTSFDVDGHSVQVTYVTQAPASTANVSPSVFS